MKKHTFLLIGICAISYEMHSPRMCSTRCCKKIPEDINELSNKDHRPGPNCCFLLSVISVAILSGVVGAKCANDWHLFRDQKTIDYALDGPLITISNRLKIPDQPQSTSNDTIVPQPTLDIDTTVVYDITEETSTTLLPNITHSTSTMQESYSLDHNSSTNNSNNIKWYIEKN